MKKWYIKSIILLVGIISLFTLKRVNALGAITYRSGTQLSSCTNCNQIDIPFGQSITDVRINYGDKQYTAGEKFVVHVGLEFRGNQPYLDSINSCTFYIDVNNTTASWSGTVGRNYYETNSQYLSYSSGFGFVTGEIPVNMASFTANSYVICNITNDSLGRDMNHFGFDMRFSSIGGDLNSAIANAADSINANNNANNNSVLNGISQGNQNLQDINSDMDDVIDMFEESNEIGGEISDKMDTNNTLLGTISSKIQSFKDSVDGFLSGISEKIGDLIFGQKVCEYKEFVIDFNQLPDNYDRQYLDSSGNFVNSSLYKVSDYYSFTSGTSLVLVNYGETNMHLASFCLYDKNKNLKSCTPFRNQEQFSLNLDYDGFIRTSVRNGTSVTLKLNNCENGNQTIFGLIKDFFSNNVLGLNDLDDTLGDFLDSLDGNEVLSDVHDFLLSPVNMLNNIRNTSSSTRCNNINTTMFNHSIVFPSGCFFWNRSDVSDFRNFWNVLFGGSLIFTLGFQYFKVLHNAFDPTKDDLGGLNI